MKTGNGSTLYAKEYVSVYAELQLERLISRYGWTSG